MNKSYTVGFLFDAENRSKIILVQKARPQWQAGRWNGPGGLVERGENEQQCMHREFMEEISRKHGANIDWNAYAVLHSLHKTDVWFFRAFVPIDVLKACIIEGNPMTSQSDEPWALWDVNSLPDVIPNLRYLIPMALSIDYDKYNFLQIYENEAIWTP